ncbi:MAG: caspase family protein [Planctomycetia bacterium]|nr:caspase family protein [Planctomycetia bacterium]
MRLVCLALLLLGLIAPLPAQDKVSSEQPILVLDAGGHTAVIRRVLFTPDGRQIVSAGHDKTIRVWDALTGEPLQVIRPPVGLGDEGCINAAALTPDGKSLAIGGMPYGSFKFGSMVHVISLETGQVTQVLRGHRHIITTVAISPDGKRLASGSVDRTIRIHDLATGQLVHELIGHQSRVSGVVFSPDGKRLASSSNDKTGRIWSVTTGKSEAELSGHDHEALCIAWSPDGKSIATSTANRTIYLFDASGKIRQTFAGQKSTIVSLTFTPDSKRLLSTGGSYGSGKDTRYACGLLDTASGKEVVNFARHSNIVAHGSIAPDGKWAVTAGGNDPDIYIWNAADGNLVHQLSGKGKVSFAAGWSADGKSIVWGNTNSGPVDKAANPLERSFRLDELEFGGPPEVNVQRAVLTRGNRSLVRSADAAMFVLENGKPIHRYVPPAGGSPLIYCFTFLGDDRTVVGSANGLDLFDLKTMRSVRPFFGHSGNMMAVAPSPDGRFLLSAATDQKLCIWDPAKSLPLLSLFFADDDWIAWTPEGYYACSANGERLMGWQINHGPDAVASYYPAAQFRKSLYHPEVIKRLLQAGSLAKALALVGKEKAPIPSVTVAEVLPPAVAITSPAPETATQLKQSKVEVKATAKSVGKHPVTALRLLLDGRPYKGQAGVKTITAPKLGEVQQTWAVELTPGKHTLTVQAESAVSKALSAPAEVNFVGKATEPNLYVLAVGVSAYPGSLRLNYAASDAEAITKVLQAKAGKAFGKVEVKVLTDRQATKAEILKGLDWLAARMTGQDVGVFFFSGHGARGGDGPVYLVPVDSDANNTIASCVSGDRVKQALAEMPGRLIALLDACHSGAAAESAKRPARSLTDDLVRDLVTEDYGVIVMCSSLGREYSLESSSVKAGFFTHALVEGLTGKADTNRDGSIFLGELDLYASRQVRLLSKGQQNPVTAKPPHIRSFVLAKP